jgi:hypothetical protein
MYKNKEWINWRDFLGIDFLPFSEAREYARSLGLNSLREWRKLANDKRLPQGVPVTPYKVYKKEGWTNWGDFLGTGRSLKKDFKAVPFSEAREYARSLGLYGYKEWYKLGRENRLPEGIPHRPEREKTYKQEWTDWGDFLGTGRISTQIAGWSIEKVKELIKDLIENKVIYEWSDDERYHLLLSKGVLNLGSSRYLPLFKDLIIGPKTEEDRKKLEEFVKSDQDNLPDISIDEELKEASTAELAEMVKKEGQIGSLEDEKIQNPKKILAQTKYLESICDDIELMQFFVTKFINKLWKRAFKDVKKGTTANEIRRIGHTGKKFHDTVTETFLSEYDAMDMIKLPKGYAFPYSPTLMQRYVTYRVQRDPYFGNFSETGAGKTLSAILASRVIDSKMTLVVCPNDVVDQWAIKKKISIPEIFSDSKVITGKSAFYTKYHKNKRQYLVLNYDLFSQPYSSDLILSLVKEKIDFVILDEIHFIKRREDQRESKRRKNLDGLLTAIRKKNSKVKVLGLTATPVINHLMEGRSLL